MKKKVFFTLIFLGLILFSALALAAGEPAKIDVNLPGPYDIAKTGPVGFIGNFYYLALGFGGLLAFGSIVYAGIRWTTSQGNPSTISDAKDQIVQALWGLVLLGGAFVILNTINPELTVLQIPQLSEIEVASSTTSGAAQEYSCFNASTGAAGDSCYEDSTCNGECATGETCKPDSECTAPAGTCPGVDPLTPIESFGTQAVAMEGGQKVIWSSDDSGVQANLNILRGEYDRLQTLGRERGFSATANSVYRPAGYQSHLREILVRSNKLVAMSSEFFDQNPGCKDLNRIVLGEEKKHTICRGSTQGICVVAQNSPHTRGVAVDLQLSGISASALDTLLKSRSFRLHLAPIQGDPVHFEI